MLNIVIPMAGRGSRFEKAGYSFPKPLIDVAGEPMISRVVKNLMPNNRKDIKFHFIVQKDHLDKYDLKNVLKLACAPYEFTLTVINQVTQGAACTVLLASEHFNNEDALMIANSDQIIDSNDMGAWHRVCYLAEVSSQQEIVDGKIMSFESNHPKWSYARTNDVGHVVEIAEKRVISPNATTGLYWYRKGSDFVEGASEMIRKDIRTKDEFYVCPVYNELVLADKVLRLHEIKAEAMHGVGTPEDLQTYLTHLQNV